MHTWYLLDILHIEFRMQGAIKASSRTHLLASDACGKISVTRLTVDATAEKSARIKSSRRAVFPLPGDHHGVIHRVRCSQKLRQLHNIMFGKNDFEGKTSLAPSATRFSFL